jgi:hypothetical protein
MGHTGKRVKERGAGLHIWLRPGALHEFFVLEVDHVRLYVPLLLVVFVQHGQRGHFLTMKKLDVFDEELVKS